jgi:hypothetical protein
MTDPSPSRSSKGVSIPRIPEPAPDGVLAPNGDNPDEDEPLCLLNAPHGQSCDRRQHLFKNQFTDARAR